MIDSPKNFPALNLFIPVLINIGFMFATEELFYLLESIFSRRWHGKRHYFTHFDQKCLGYI